MESRGLNYIRDNYLKKVLLKKIFFFLTLCLVLIGGVGAWLYSDNHDQDSLSPFTEQSSFSLEHVQTHSLAQGTHRPEILTYENKLFILVVEPENDTLHQGYIFDATDPSKIDFSTPIKKFPISTTTDDYGKPADHRATIIGDELVVVYQTLVLPENMGRIQGPTESYAESQSLMFARLDLDGNMIATSELVRSTDFAEDNFPDMCVLSNLNNKTLLVSTGGEMQFKIREVNLDGEILNTYNYKNSRDTVADSIGNSLFWGLNRELIIFSGLGPSNGDITATTLSDDFNLDETIVFEDEGESTFPTGILSYKDYFLVAYSSRESGGDVGIETNPLSPRLMILDADFNVKETIIISDEAGQGHVHPTMAIIGDRLFYAWSKRIENENLMTPQVQIEEFKII